MNRYHIRWMVRSDLYRVLGTEKMCFSHPWREEDFLHSLRRRDCIGMVAECEETIRGYMFYEIHKYRLNVINFAVHPLFQRQNVGSEMVAKLVSKLGEQRNCIMMDVRETNVAAQLFFKHHGFKVIRVMRNYYDDCDEDAYLMQRRYVPEVEAVEPINRLPEMRYRR